MTLLECDYLIIGSGLAGLSAARKLSPHGKVIVVTKRERWNTNTNCAQGGIACVTREDDSVESHVADTIDAGAGLCDEEVVRRIVSEAPARVDELRAIGIEFSASENNPEEPDLGREGGHSARRILHCGDMTGRVLQEGLLRAADSDPNITIMEHTQAIDLVTRNIDGVTTCVGCYLFQPQTGMICAVRASYTLLATGGAGRVYRYTSNPDVAVGGGIAIAWRAGAEVRNMEFMQFHPTCLYHPKAKNFLISEAVRGEGAKLVDNNGEAFMTR